MRNALQRLKYKKDIGLGEALAQPLIELFLSLDWAVDLIVPIPLSATRKAERGYNQVALLALPLALRTAIPYRPQALTRLLDTRSQVGLTGQERRENLRGAFSAASSLVKGRRVLLLDDVITTGSTMNAGAEALIEAGARCVFGLTLARVVYS